MKKIQLSIPEPCQQNWDDMTPTQQGRFCNACTKQVIDFSEMSDTEVLNYFNKVKNETVCGRAYPDQLDRTITATPKKKIYWYLNYAIAFVLFFSKANSSKAQTRKGMILPKPVGAVNLSVAKNTNTKKLIINGTVKDENRQAVPFASVRLLHSNDGAAADINGCFILKVDSLNSRIEISALGYETKQAAINYLSEKEIILVKTSALMKEVVVASHGYSVGNIRLRGMIVRCVKPRRNILKDTLRNWISNINPTIKIYPSPVPKGNTFTAALKLKQTGNLTIQLSDAAGRMVLQKQINAITKEHKEQLQSSSGWSAGIYYVRVLDEKGKLLSTGTVVLQ